MSEDLSFSVPRRVSAGYAHNLLVSQTKSLSLTQLRCWGGNNETTLAPSLLRTFKGRLVFEVACGDHHSLILSKKPDEDGGIVYMAVEPPSSTLVALSAETENNCFRILSFPQGTKIARVAAGACHSLAISDTGRVFSWGQGHFGALGLGDTRSFAPTPLPVSTIREEIQQVAAGAKHSLALSKNGTLFSWGFGGNGRLGLSNSDAALLPQPITLFLGTFRQSPGVPKISFVACGDAHSAAADTLGQLFTWGSASHGRLGHGVGVDLASPLLVDALRSREVQEIALGSFHSLVLTRRGRVFGWGSGPQVGLGLEVGAVHKQPRELDRGFDLMKAGQERCGAGKGGGRGAGEDGEEDEEIEDLDLDAVTVKIPAWECGDEKISQICAGRTHSIATTTRGRIFTWGVASDARLGHGCCDVANSNSADSRLFEDILWPREILPAPKGPALAWLGDPGFSGNGNSEDEQLLSAKTLQPDQEEIEAAAMYSVADLQAGGDLTAVSTGIGALYLWGSNTYGQAAQPLIGASDGSAYGGADVKLPTRCLSFSSPVQLVAVGGAHCLGLTKSGLLFAWGRNDSGQLGTGRGRDLVEPGLIEGLSEITACSAGEDHSACISSFGELYSWGSAEFGKLGQGESLVAGCQLLPRMVRGSVRYETVSCGAQHTIALGLEGAAYSCGAGWFGRLGQGSGFNAARFQKMLLSSGGNTRFGFASAGSFHTLLISLKGDAAGGFLYGCGRDRLLGSSDHELSLLRLPYFEQHGISVRHCAASTDFSLVVSAAGFLYAWGSNSRGQLGISLSVPFVPRPERVVVLHATLDSFSTVAGGSAHSLALASDGRLFGSGCNVSGRLGLGPDITEKAVGGWRLVTSPWEEGMAAGGRKKGLNGEAILNGDIDVGGKVGIFTELQTALLNEPKANKLSSLQSKEKALSEEYKAYLALIISGVEDPHSPKQVLEKSFADIERHLCKLYKALGLGSRNPYLRTDAVKGKIVLKRNGGNTSSACQSFSCDTKRPSLGTEIRTRMGDYEEMVWLLQMQPSYLAKLGDSLTRDRDTGLTRLSGCDIPQNDAEKNNLWLRACRQIFARIGSLRTRVGLKALLRVLIRYELKGQKRLDCVFKKESSKSADLFNYFATHREWWGVAADSSYLSPKTLHPRHRFGGRSGSGFLLDVTNAKSLAAILLHATFRVVPGEKSTNLLVLSHDAGHFAEKMAYFKPLLLTKSKTTSGDFDFDSQAAAFQDLVLKEVEPEVLERFHWVNRDVGNLIKRAFLLIQESVAEARTLPAFHGLPNDKICEPILRLLVGEYLAPMLSKARSQLPVLLKREVKKLCQGLWEKREEDTTKKEEDKTNPKPLGFVVGGLRGFRSSSKAAKAKKQRDRELLLVEELFYHNLSVVGEALEREISSSDTVSTPFFSGLKTRLLHSLTLLLAHPSKGLQDTTETELTIDTYARHFDNAHPYVQLSVSDAVRLGNLFWERMHPSEDSSSDTKRIELRMDSSNANGDPLERVLQKTQPSNNLESRVWDSKAVKKLQTALPGLHNFMVDHKFVHTFRPYPSDPPLEALTGKLPLLRREKYHFRTFVDAAENVAAGIATANRLREACFCRESQSGVPRFMTGAAQKGRSGVRYLKPFLVAESSLFLKIFPDTLKKCDLNPLRFLELILEDVSSLKSRDFIALRYELEEKQRFYSNLYPPRFALATRLEKAKKLLQLLHREGVEEEVFARYVKAGITAREEQASYVASVEDGRAVVEELIGTFSARETKVVEDVVRMREFCMKGFQDLEKEIKRKSEEILNSSRRGGIFSRSTLKPLSLGNVGLKLGTLGDVVREFSVQELEDKKVLLRKSPILKSTKKKTLKLEFRSGNGSAKVVWQVVGFVVEADGFNRRNFTEFNISQHELELMRGSCCEVSFGDASASEALLVLDSKKLVALLARL